MGSDYDIIGYNATMQKKAVTNIIGKLKVTDDTPLSEAKAIFDDLLISFPAIMAWLYEDEPVDHLALTMDTLKDDAILKHTQHRLDERKKEMDKL